MFLTRISEQSSKSLDEHYADLASRRYPQDVVATKMSEFLRCLESLGDGRRLWAYTSHLSLVIVGEDCSSSDTLASVKCADQEFVISTPVPVSQSPWEDAWFIGWASTVPGAAEMTLRAVTLHDLPNDNRAFE